MSVTSHILGVHLIPVHNRDSDYDYIRRLQPSSVKIVDPDVMHIHRVHDAAPNALIVLRDHPLSEQHDDVRRDPEGTGVRHARRWREKIDDYQAQASQRGLRLPPIHQTVVLGINEPQVWTMLGETVRYNVAFLNECSRLGIRAGALNLSVGWPNNTGPDTPVDWKPYAPIEAAIKAGRHILFLHEYHDHRGVVHNWRWWCGRYEQCPWDVPIIIGECGLDEYVSDPAVGKEMRGWRGWYDAAEYVTQLMVYANRCAQDGRIQSMQPFTTDGASDWYSFDTEPAHGAILARTWPVPKQGATPTVIVRPAKAKYVTAVVLNVRSGAGTEHDIVTTLQHGARVMVDGTQGEWARIPQGWVHGSYLSDDAPDMGSGPDVVVLPVQPGIIDPRTATAILQIESGGQGFGPGGRLMIRFEAHLFNRQTGNAYRHLFQHGSPEWTGHLWREKENEVWLTLHTGNQNSEWEAFEFASTLNRNAALQSISMGAPQILGSHYRRIGYQSAEAMFRAFGNRQYGMAAQMVGFTNFCLSSPQLMQGIARRDFRTVARLYNGSGQVEHYAALMQSAYDRLG